jgi:hypothetical protein
MGFLLGLYPAADLAVVVVDVGQGDIHRLGRDFLDRFEHLQRQVRRQVETAVEMRTADHHSSPLRRTAPAAASLTAGLPTSGFLAFGFFLVFCLLSSVFGFLASVFRLLASGFSLRLP